MQGFLNECESAWMSAWNPGDYLVIDESMIGWSGVGQNELAYLPRKPCDLGVMLKSMVCSDSGIMLRAEISEGKDIMRTKEYVKEWGQTTATVLRIVKPYFGEGYIIIGDGWFGSVRCAYILRKHGTFCIMNVKTSNAGYPNKADFLHKMEKRGDKLCVH